MNTVLGRCENTASKLGYWVDTRKKKIMVRHIPLMIRRYSQE